MAAPASATPTTSLTSSSTAGAPVLAFTTPFAQPASCSSLFTTTVSTYTDFSTSYVTWLFPDKSNPLYTSCLDPAGSNQFTFSPAVCPESWVAWNLGTTAAATATATGSTAYISTAFCCAPSYTYLSQGDQASPSCQRDLPSSGDPTGTVKALSKAQLPAWHISWQTTDVPTLSPQPPALGGETITRWVPGSGNPETQPHDNWGGGGMNSHLFYFLVAGIPILVVAGVAACLFPLCRSRLRAKRTRL